MRESEKKRKRDGQDQIIIIKSNQIKSNPGTENNSDLQQQHREEQQQQTTIVQLTESESEFESITGTVRRQEWNRSSKE